jgi:hypothetical protein
MATTLTLTGATDLTVTGLVEGPPGVFSLPPVSLSVMDFIAAPGPVSGPSVAGLGGSLVDPWAASVAFIAGTWTT